MKKQKEKQPRNFFSSQKMCGAPEKRRTTEKCETMGTRGGEDIESFPPAHPSIDSSEIFVFYAK